MSSQNLKNFWLNIKRDKKLLGILSLGFLLRFLNPTFGSPSLYLLNDEAIAHLSALNMLASKTPVSIANYTPLGAYLQIPFLAADFLLMKFLGIVNGVRAFELFLLTHEGYFLYVPRIISVFFGTMLILVIYRITLILFKEKSAALLAAFLTAVSFNMVHISHFGRPWAAALFFLALSYYFVLKNKVVSSFLSAAVSFGFHQVGIFAFPLILLFGRIRARAIFGLILGGILILIFSNLTLKTGLLSSIGNGQSFLKDKTLATDILTGHFEFGKSLGSTIHNNLLTYFTLNFLVTDGIILIFGILGILKSLQRGRAHWVLVIFVLGYFLFASFFFWPLLRYVLPAFLLLIPLAAYGISFLAKRRILLAFLLAIASVNSLWWNFLYLKTPTFIQARSWVNNNLAANIPIAYTGARYQTFVPNKETIELVENVDPGFYKMLYALLDTNSYDNVRNIINVSKFPGKTKLREFESATANYKVEYIIDYYLNPSERIYLEDKNRFEIVKQFSPLNERTDVGLPEPLFDSSYNFEIWDLKNKVSMYKLQRFGPYFDILRVKDYSVLTNKNSVLPSGK